MVASAPTSPALAPSIEDQVLEAIISGILPTDPASKLGTRHAAPGTSDPSALTSSPAHLLTSPSLSPLALSRHFRLPLSQLLDFLSLPSTRARLSTAQELADLAFHQRSQKAREEALDTLQGILRTSEDPVEKRRAASAILRRYATRAPFFSRTPGAGADGPAGNERPLSLATPRFDEPEPQWEWRPPEDRLIYVLQHLQDNDNPDPASGLAALYMNKSEHYHLEKPDQAQALADYLQAPGEDANLINFTAAALHPPHKMDPALRQRRDTPDPHEVSTHPVTLTFPDGATRHYLFRFEAFPSRHGFQFRPWLITDIEPIDPPPQGEVARLCEPVGAPSSPASPTASQPGRAPPPNTS